MFHEEGHLGSLHFELLLVLTQCLLLNQHPTLSILPLVAPRSPSQNLRKTSFSSASSTTYIYAFPLRSCALNCQSSKDRRLVIGPSIMLVQCFAASANAFKPKCFRCWTLYGVVCVMKYGELSIEFLSSGAMQERRLPLHWGQIGAFVRALGLRRWIKCAFPLNFRTNEASRRPSYAGSECLSLVRWIRIISNVPALRWPGGLPHSPSIIQRRLALVPQ